MIWVVHLLWLLLGLCLAASAVLWVSLRKTLNCRASFPAYPTQRCRLHPRDHVGSHEVKFRQDKITTVISWDDREVAKVFDVAKAERELERPLADLIAEAERKAIAIHSPHTWTDGCIPALMQPGTQHPFDPCWYPWCGVARSRHEHVETIGYYSPRSRTVASGAIDVIPLRPKANLGRRDHIEVTAIGDPERQYLDGPQVVSETECKLRDRRQALYAEAKHLIDVAWLHNREFTIREQHQWNQLEEQLEVIHRRLEAIRICRRNTTSGPAKP